MAIGKSFLYDPFSPPRPPRERRLRSLFPSADASKSSTRHSGVKRNERAVSLHFHPPTKHIKESTYAGIRRLSDPNIWCFLNTWEEGPSGANCALFSYRIGFRI